MIRFLSGLFIPFFESLGEMSMLFFSTLSWTFRRPFDRKSIVSQIIQIGLDSLPVIIVTGLFTGMVFSFQTAYSLETKIKGASVLVGSVVGLALVKELGPVFSAVFVAGRVGSAISAEIGAMKITDQIDALIILRTSPVHYLVVPRFLALLIVLPIVTLFFDFVGLIGGGIVSVFTLQVPIVTYQEAFLRAVHLPDFVNGFIKSVIFGAVIAIISSREGLKTTGGAEGVGISTTKSVVTSSISILILDYLLSTFLAYVLGI